MKIPEYFSIVYQSSDWILVRYLSTDNISLHHLCPDYSSPSHCYKDHPWFCLDCRKHCPDDIETLFWLSQ